MNFTPKNYKTIPNKPGIYQFSDETKSLLYVGKAKDLQKRVSSYFKKSSTLLPKTKLMVSQIKTIKTIIVESEIEALLLEAELVNSKQPKYNHQLKDDKSFSFIHFTKEEFPRIYAERMNQILKSERKVSFGPFLSSKIVRLTLDEIRKVFPYRSCNTNRFNKHKVCLYYHLHLCQAPCEDKINFVDYQKEINYLKSFLQRKTKTLALNLKREMQKHSETESFEKAAQIRDQIERLEYLTTKLRLPQEYLQAPNLLEDLRTQVLINLQKVLKLKTLPTRIECYDISNFQGKQATGSMVVFTNAEADKKEYRRFKIKFKDTPDDYFMLYEMLKRRFSRLNDKSHWKLPDLIVIDGGEGQLSKAISIQRLLKLQVPIISLAKKEEEIYMENQPNLLEVSKVNFHKIKLSKKSKELQLLQQIRDEAHRFAITYHRKLREMKLKKEFDL